MDAGAGACGIDGTMSRDGVDSGKSVVGAEIVRRVL